MRFIIILTMAEWLYALGTKITGADGHKHTYTHHRKHIIYVCH
jgi:hypothetical protein